MKRWMRFLPIFTIISGIFCGFFRSRLYGSLDSSGLIPAGHPAYLPLNFLSIVTAAILVIAFLWQDDRDYRFRVRFPLQAIGALSGSIGMLLWFCLSPGESTLFSAVCLLGAVSFLILAGYRLTAKKPLLLLPALINITFLVLCFSQYRQWGTHTQLQGYLFPALSALSLALYSLQNLLLELPERSYKKAFFFHLGALFSSLICLSTPLWPYYLTMVIWLLGELFTRPYAMELPKDVVRCIHRLEQAGYSAFAVGGCVRDAMLGHTPHDYDLCTSAKPEEICHVFADCQLIRAGEKHGTIGVVLHSKVYEITTYRTEGDYTDNRHPDSVTFVGHVEDDLARRDFTVNAMAYHPATGYHDPFGGEKDLFSGILRTVGDPETRFREDGLRILRGVRFACRFALKPNDATAKAMKTLCPLLDNLAAERVSSEMTQILCVMDDKTLLQFSPVILQVIPELADSVGFLQRSPHHKYDVFTHTGKVLSALESDPALRWAALLHDAGKPAAFTQDEQGVGHFYDHAKISAQIAEEVLRRLKVSNALREQVIFLIAHHMDNIGADKRLLRRKLSKYGAENLRKLVKFQYTDRLGTGKAAPSEGRLLNKLLAMIDALEQEEGRLQLRDLAIDGHDLMALGFAPGPQLGQCQKLLLEQVLGGSIPNEKDALLQKAEEYLHGGNV